MLQPRKRVFSWSIQLFFLPECTVIWLEHASSMVEYRCLTPSNCSPFRALNEGMYSFPKSNFQMYNFAYSLGAGIEDCQLTKSYKLENWGMADIVDALLKYSQTCLICPLELLRVHILLPDGAFSALKQDQDCQNRPTRSQDMSKFILESLWNWSGTSFRATLWLFSRLLTHFPTYWALTNIHRGLEQFNWGVKWRELPWYWVFQGFKWVPG